MTAQLQDQDPTITSGLDQLLAACDACKNADIEQAQRKRDQIDKEEGMCDEDQANKFMADGQRIIDEMYQARTNFMAAYQVSLQPHNAVPHDLHAVFTDSWTPALQSLQPVLTDIQTRLQQQHWKGKGADAYMKQLPTQMAAVSEFQQLVGYAGAGVETPAQIQDAVFSMTVSVVNSMNQYVQSYSTRSTGERYFQRCAWARDVIKNYTEWFNNKLLTGQGTWKSAMDSHIRQMESSAVRSPQALAGDKWPTATAETKTEDIPKAPTSGGYSGPSVPSTTPVGDKGTSGGIDGGDYHDGADESQQGEKPLD